jgi:hypothetical protein
MKKLLLSIALLTSIGMVGVNGQSTLIISENFQAWEPTEDTNPDTCSRGVVLEYGITRELTLTTSTGTAQIPVTLYKCGIAPECESRRIEDGGAMDNLPGVTKGWVLLNKLTNGSGGTITMDKVDESPDTLGEFIFGPVPQIDSIRFAHSATGGNRGIRIYKSADGITWERASEDEFWDGADCQLGDVNTVEINATNVYIKFTSGFKQSDQTSQYSRLHNIDVWGIPGVVNYVKNNIKDNMLNIYPVPAKDFIIIKLATEAINSELQIIDVAGKPVYRCVVDQQTSGIDISNLISGIYFIQITHNDKKYVKQLVVK